MEEEEEMVVVAEVALHQAGLQDRLRWYLFPKQTQKQKQKRLAPLADPLLNLPAHLVVLPWLSQMHQGHGPSPLESALN